MYSVFFFKQKTAYEMRISDWRSDVCSSDLGTRCDSPQRQLEIGRGGDDRGVVAAEFEDRFAETARHALADGAAHACRTGCRDHRQTRIVDELRAKFASADEQIGRAPCRERVCQYV